MLSFGLKSLLGAGTAIALTSGAYAQEGSSFFKDEKTLDTVIVNFDRLDGDPGAFFRVPEETLNEIGRDHPAEVLNQAPGVNIQMNSGQEHLIGLRSPVLTGGAGQGSFLILVDGVPTRASAFGNVNSLFELPYETAQGLEVIRGPGSARYGSNAVHGIINVVQPLPGDETGYRLQASASTLDRYRIDGVTSADGGDVDWLLGASLQDDKGWRDESGLQQQKLTGRLSGELGRWDMVASLFATNLNQETAGFLQGENAYQDADVAKTNPNPEAYRDAYYGRASLQASRTLGEGIFFATPYYIHQRMEFLQHFLPYKGLEKNGQDVVGLQTQYLVEDGVTSWRIGADVEWAEGFLKETQENPFGFFPGDSRFPVGTHYDYEVETLKLAAFVQLGQQLTPDLKLLAGMRVEQHDYDYATQTPAGVFGRFRVAVDRSDDFTIATPKLGLVWSGLEDVEIYANYARGERAPQASDLYRLQSQQLPGDAETETLDSLEIGWRGRIDDYDLIYDVAAYAARKENFFFRDADGLNVTDGETEHIGIEALVQRRVDEGFNWSLSATYAEHSYAFNREVGNASEVIVDGNEVDTAPNWLVDASLGYDWGRMSLALDIEHIGEYFTNAANTRSYEGHTIAHLRSAFELTDSVEAFVIVRNLTDEGYADRADFAFGNERYFPGEPLNAAFGLRISG